MMEIFEKNSINFDKLWAVLTNFSENFSKILKNGTKPGNPPI